MGAKREAADRLIWATRVAALVAASCLAGALTRNPAKPESNIRTVFAGGLSNVDKTFDDFNFVASKQFCSTPPQTTVKNKQLLLDHMSNAP